MSGLYCLAGLGKTPVNQAAIERVVQTGSRDAASTWQWLGFSNAPWLRIGVHDRPGAVGYSVVHRVEGERLCGVVFGAFPTRSNRESLCLDEWGGDLSPDSILEGLRERYADVFDSWEEGGCLVLTETKEGRVVGLCDWWGQERLYYKVARDCVLLSNDDYAVASWPQGRAALADEQCRRFLREGVWGRDGKSLYGSDAVKAGNSVIVDGRGVCELAEYSVQLLDPVGAANGGRELLEDLWNGVAARCRAYAASGETLALSLTGGVDSRLVLSALIRENIDYELATFVSSENVTRDEAVANEVARTVGKQLRRIEVGPEFFDNYLDYHQQAVRASAGAMGREGPLELYCNRRMADLGGVRITGTHGGEILRDVSAPNVAVAEAPGFRREWIGGDLAKEEAPGKSAPPNAGSLDGKIKFLRSGLPYFFYDNRKIERSQLFLVTPYLDLRFTRRLLSSSTQSLRKEDFLSTILSKTPELGAIALDRRGVRVVGSRAFLRRRWAQDLTFKLEYFADYGMPNFKGSEPLAGVLRRFESRLLGRHKFSHFRKWYEGPLSRPVKEALLDPSFLNDARIARSDVERIVHEHVGKRRNHTIALHKLMWFAVIK